MGKEEQDTLMTAALHQGQVTEVKTEVLELSIIMRTAQLT
jgi:hypothetical protein